MPIKFALKERGLCGVTGDRTPLRKRIAIAKILFMRWIAISLVIKFFINGSLALEKDAQRELTRWLS